MSARETRRAEQDVVPQGVELIHGEVEQFDPDQQAVQLISGDRLTYDVLIVALGIQINWSSVEGLLDQRRALALNHRHVWASPIGHQPAPSNRKPPG